MSKRELDHSGELWGHDRHVSVTQGVRKLGCLFTYSCSAIGWRLFPGDINSLAFPTCHMGVQGGIWLQEKALDSERQVLKAAQCQCALKRKEQSGVGRAPTISASLHEIQRRSHAMDQQIGHSAFLIIRVKEKGFVAQQCKDLQTSHDFQSPFLAQVSMVL